MPRVVLMQARLVHYRVKLFSLMKSELERNGIELILAHGQASATERLRKDEGHLPWAVHVRNRIWNVGGKDVVWQPFPRGTRDVDLCIVMQESRIVSNYWLQLQRLFSGMKVAYWGHGRNLQSTSPNGLREKWKQFLLDKVDWWFAYTDITVDHLLRGRYPRDRITNIQNAIDVAGFQADLAEVSSQDLVERAASLGIPADARVGLFCGSLYPGKRIDLLLDGADLTRAAVPKFHLVVIGAGPSLGEVQAAARTRPWLHVVGPQRGHEKAVLYRLAHVQLNPGLVGLHVLDAFSAGVPMVTTATALHSPEIAYLRDGDTGRITVSDTPRHYAEAVIELLLDEQRRMELATKGLRSAEIYTVENMSKNFCAGIMRCLERHGRLGSEFHESVAPSVDQRSTGARR